MQDDRRSRASSRHPIRCRRRSANGSFPEVLVHRYYDPATEQFLSVDPEVDETGTPYAFTGGDPVNESDPLGLWGWNPISDVVEAAKDVGHAANEALPVVHEVANVVAIGASLCAAVTSETVVGGVTCGTIAVAAGGVTAASGLALYVEGRESGTTAAIDVASAGLGGLGSLAEAGAGAARGLAEEADAASLLREAEMDSAPWYGKAGPWLASQWWAAKAAFWSGTETGLADLSRVLSAGGFGLGLYGEFSSGCS
jgi:hypothetical protein